MKAHIITIGDEILIGQIVDTNSAWMATELNLAGIEVTAIHTIPDDAATIQATIRQSAGQADLILTTGGLGATKDDVTKNAIAELLGVGMYFDGALYDRIVAYFDKRGIPVTAAHRQQCMMPETMTTLPNGVGVAPGMWLEYQGRILVSMPGVPHEMKHLMETQVLPRMREKWGLRPIWHRTLVTAGTGETELASQLEQILDSFPSNLKIAYLPNLGEVRLRLSAYGEAGRPLEELRQLVNDNSALIEAQLGHSILGYEKDSIQEVVGSLLLDKGWQLATAESCTGGNIAARLVRVPGSSAYFKGGIVAYSNAVKTNQLGVSPQTLEQYGAVSEETVREMVRGACQRIEVDVALAISGIAGPGGGTEEKPVGLVWIAVGNADKITTHRLQLGRDRGQNIEYATKRALNLLRLYLLGL